eukprot:SAG11_NODE_1947_length_4015_cov_20.610827_6_plen_40_part_00
MHGDAIDIEASDSTVIHSGDHAVVSAAGVVGVNATVTGT